MFLSRDQELDDRVPSSETGALPTSSQPITKERRLNYQRHRQGALTTQDAEASMCPDRVVFHP
eukprot:11220115-Alexandrium_andersonii.AAC.1